MTTATKGYLIIAGSVIYHLVAIYSIMLLVDLHIAIVSILAVLWLISLPITLWKSSKYIGVKSDGLTKEVSSVINNDSKE